MDFCRPHGSQKFLLYCFARVESFCPALPSLEFGSARPGPLGTPQEDRPGPPGPGPARPSQPRLGQAQSAPTQPGPASPGSAWPSQPRLGQAQPGPARLPRGPTGPRSVSPGPPAHLTLASLAHTLIFIFASCAFGIMALLAPRLDPQRAGVPRLQGKSAGASATSGWERGRPDLPPTPKRGGHDPTLASVAAHGLSGSLPGRGRQGDYMNYLQVSLSLNARAA